MTLRWLQWATADLEHGLGGVETHARCLQRELRALGVEATISSDPRELRGSYDVIHTHGCFVPPRELARALVRRRRPLRLHTLHGETFGRMWAGREPLYLGGYAAGAREVAAVAAADGILAVHGRLGLVRFARSLGRPVRLCGNGWDSVAAEPKASVLSESLPSQVESSLPGGFWAFVGRGSDPIKGTDLLVRALDGLPGARLAAAPGEGFSHPRVTPTGALTPGQVRTLMARARGLVCSSRYEGMPLVVLEALALGTPVVATPVGGIRELPKSLQGLWICDAASVDALRAAMDAVEAKTIGEPPEARVARATANRSLLRSWRDVARECVDLAERLLGPEM